MKKILLICLLLLPFRLLKAQINLVPNPSFEQLLNCPFEVDQMVYCSEWDTYGNSPDYYNSCGNNPTSSFQSIVDVPSSFTGFQRASSGNAYAGIDIWADPSQSFFNNSMYRELIGCHLIQRLVIGTKYFFSCDINLASRSMYASNNIGILCTNRPYDEIHLPIYNKTQFNMQSIYTDTLNWLKIKGSFIADSNYNQLIIGNFYVDSLTSLIYSNGYDSSVNTLHEHVAYYYIDNVCLSTDSVYAYNYEFISENIGLNQFNEVSSTQVVCPNPVINEFTISLPAETKRIQIHNPLGQLLINQELNKSLTTYKKDISELPSGLYFVTIISRNESRYSQFIKQ